MKKKTLKYLYVRPLDGFRKLQGYMDSNLRNKIIKAVEIAGEAISDIPIVIGNEPIFRLCVELQRELGCDIDVLDMEPAFNYFFKQYRDDLEDLFDEEEAWIQFLDAWPKVKIVDILKRAVQMAQKSPIVYKGTKLRPKQQYFASVCKYMQDIVGPGQVFYLSSYQAAESIIADEGKHRQAHRYLGSLCTLGILEKVSTGNFASRKANEYRYIYERPDLPK